MCNLILARYLFSLSNPNLYIAIALAIINSVLMCYVGYKYYQILQLSNYSNKKFLVWIKDTKANWVSRTLMLTLLSCMCLLVCNALFNAYESDKFFSYFGLLFYFAFITIFIYYMLKTPRKVALKLTKRMWRLIITSFLIMLIFSFFMLVLTLNLTNYFSCTAIGLTPICMPIAILLANLINMPLEKLIYKKYIKKASKKLFQMPELKIIGITGSYGKTSVKNFLKDLLSAKYKVCASEASYNTPMGLTKTILNQLKLDDEIFIAEMGADNVGDINEICKFIKPNVAILTAIGNQHLKSFGSIENIQKTKYELIENLPKDGLAFFNGECDELKPLIKKCELENKIVAIFNGDFVKLSNIQSAEDGTKFEILFENKKYSLSTKLIGLGNLTNIFIAINVALKLGVSVEKIVSLVENLKSVPHRLELRKTDNGITIIDDSFNANIIGAKIALDTLNTFKDSRKIIVTPGLVELGKDEESANEKFGLEISKVADLCIIVNKTNSLSIKKGLENGGYNMQNVIETETLTSAMDLFKTLLKVGDVVLLENDLPDNYI